MAKQQGTESEQADKQAGQLKQGKPGSELGRADAGGTERQGLGRQREREWPGFFSDSPFGIMRRLTEDFDRMFEELAFGGRGRGRAMAYIPQIEVIERENELVIRADLPGMRKEDVRIEVVRDMLVISGERKMEEEREERGVRRSERQYGSFQRAISLPEGCDPEEATAEFKDGVLEIKFPYQRRSGSRRIEIRGGEGSGQQTH